MVVKTVYRVQDPESLKLRQKPEDFHEVEYRELVLSTDSKIPGEPWFVRLHQGWWDQSKARPINPKVLFHGRYERQQEAEAAFEEQLQNLASTGFVHSFTPDPMSERGTYYERLK